MLYIPVKQFSTNMKPSQTPSKKLRILCAFDPKHESTVFSDETEEIEEAGHTLIKVRSLQEMNRALNDAAKQNPFDVLLADYYLKDVTGSNQLYYTNRNLSVAIRVGVKCIGLFSPVFEKICDFRFIQGHNILVMVDNTCRTVTDQRDVSKLFKMLWGNYAGHSSNLCNF